MAEATNQTPTRTRGPKLEPYQVVLRPLITEKGTHQSTHRNAYPFEVSLWATKDDIRAAVQELFGVRVLRVRTQTRQGKKLHPRFDARRSFGWKKTVIGKRSRWKKAIVTLHAEDRIEFF
jgi:large subunit ribosomal protein L23